MKAKVQNSTFQNAQGRRFQSKNRSLTLNHTKSTFPTQQGTKQQKPVFKGKNASLVNLNARVATTPSTPVVSTVPATPVVPTVPAAPTQKKFRVVHHTSTTPITANPQSAPSSPTHKETTTTPTPAPTPAPITSTPTPTTIRVSLIRPLSPTKSVSAESTSTPASSLSNEDKKRSHEECDAPTSTPTIISKTTKRLRISTSSRSPPQSPPQSPTTTESPFPSLSPSPSPSSLPSIESEAIRPLSPTQVSSSPSPSAPSSPLTLSSPPHSAPSSPASVPSPLSTPCTAEVPITPLPPSSCSTTHNYIEEWMEEEEKALKSTLSSPVSFSTRMEGINDNESHDLAWAEDW